MLPADAAEHPRAGRQSERTLVLPEHPCERVADVDAVQRAPPRVGDRCSEEHARARAGCKCSDEALRRPADAAHAGAAVRDSETVELPDSSECVRAADQPKPVPSDGVPNRQAIRWRLARVAIDLDGTVRPGCDRRSDAAACEEAGTDVPGARRRRHCQPHLVSARLADDVRPDRKPTRHEPLPLTAVQRRCRCGGEERGGSEGDGGHTTVSPSRSRCVQP
jgi:hypothetical protein